MLLGDALPGVLTVDEVLALQKTAGNRSVTRMLTRAAAGTAAPPPGGGVSEADRKLMDADVSTIVERLKEQLLDAGEEQALVARVKAWADKDAATEGSGTPHLD